MWYFFKTPVSLTTSWSIFTLLCNFTLFGMCQIYGLVHDAVFDWVVKGVAWLLVSTWKVKKGFQCKLSLGWYLPWLSPGYPSSVPTPPPGGRRQRETPRNTPPPGCWWTSRKVLQCVRRPPSLAWQRKSCRRRSSGYRGTEWLKVWWVGQPVENKHSVCCYLLFQEWAMLPV